MKLNDLINNGGAAWFGLVIGWITSVTFHSTQQHGTKEIATIIGIIGGASVTKLFSKTNTQFSHYCVGLALGFIFHILVSLIFWHGKVWPIP
jgi:hypothetical protein